MVDPAPVPSRGVDQQDHDHDGAQAQAKPRPGIHEFVSQVDLQLIAIIIIAFCIGIPVGYMFSGDCGQERYNALEITLQDFLDSLNQKIDTRLANVDDRSKTFYNEQKVKLEGLHTSLTNSDSSIKSTVTDIGSSMMDLKSAIGKIESSQNTLAEELSSLDSQVKDMSAKIKQSSSDFKTETEKVVQVIGTLSQTSTIEIKETASQMQSDVKKKITVYEDELRTSSNNIETVVGNLNERVTELSSNVEKIAKDQSKLAKIVLDTEGTSTALGTTKNILEAQVNQIKTIFRGDEKRAPEADRYISWGLSIVQIVLILMVHAAVTKLAERREGQRQASPAGGVQIPLQQGIGSAVGRRAPNPQRQPPTGPPQYDISIVTFTQETYEQAKRVFPELLGQSWPAKVQYVMLTGALDLSQVPSSRGYIIVIGYDARNSIVEDMDGSMGSRKRQTIVGLQGTQREVVVIYIDSDHQIEEPPEGALYNTHLDRPTSHPILAALVRNQKFLSFRHWRGTRNQAIHLETWIRQLR